MVRIVHHYAARIVVKRHCAYVGHFARCVIKLYTYYIIVAVKPYSSCRIYNYTH